VFTKKFEFVAVFPSVVESLRVIIASIAGVTVLVTKSDLPNSGTLEISAETQQALDAADSVMAMEPVFYEI
jgi:hypothetical protein